LYEADFYSTIDNNRQEAITVGTGVTQITSLAQMTDHLLHRSAWVAWIGTGDDRLKEYRITTDDRSSPDETDGFS